MTDNSLIPYTPLELAGQIANEHAANAVFADFRSRKAPNTNRRHDAALALFSEYLQSAGLPVGDFATDPQAWRGVTWGLLEGFIQWQLREGYAIGTVGGYLAVVKVYCKLAFKAGALDATEHALIRTVQPYSRQEGRRIDEQRKENGVSVRRGHKKSNPTPITDEQAEQLLDQPATPKGKRDALMLCLMLEHGLRVGEVAGLQVADFDLPNRRMTFYRSKVGKVQTHRLTDRTLRAALRYFEIAPKAGCLWRRGERVGSIHLSEQGMSTRAMIKRVELLGRQIGIEHLSPHDLRHAWATRAARAGTAIRNLQEAGGWASPIMPLRYIEAEQIANDGVITDRKGGE
jgi:integrase